ncbi:tol-pal system-associated acyl-CoA thioesterase [Thalassococcus sp. S3]|uniref:tol-pal system-associated acyl-CoA thioesterase n=1 Tax=Thalassococcus sp. S3 TaxID=2017482 RepID=UPI00102428D3|nr:tol-pal system-associated acyl-CoA thioesterase [Thalassococcus sp. S3]QBF32978.1 tol-pal system-associated acyl-CoA thioesterase [Thalassococcus sp. S3]
MTHRYPVRVYYEDTDMGGIVYHANYLRYIERARSDWVRQLGIDQNQMRDDGVVFVVRKIDAEYIATAKFEDLLEVETVASSITGARLVMDQVVWRGEDVIFRAVVTAVCMNDKGVPVRLPAAIRALSS